MTPAPGRRVGFNSTDKGAIMAFLLFAGNDYYADGGIDDLRGKFETMEDCEKGLASITVEISGGWAHIFNLDSMRIVKRFKRDNPQADWVDCGLETFTYDARAGRARWV